MPNYCPRNPRQGNYQHPLMVRDAHPTWLLGMKDRGHLGIGAGADITVYTEQEDLEAMFAKPDYVFKDGELVVKHGEVVKIVWGNDHTVKPEFDRASVEKDLRGYYDKYLTMKLDNFIIRDEEIEEDGRSKIIVHPCGRA